MVPVAREELRRRVRERLVQAALPWDPRAEGLPGRHFLTIDQVSGEELGYLFDLAAALKAARRRHHFPPLLAGRHLAMIFHKPSTRTRVSFEVAMAELGGRALYLAGSELQLGRGESLADTARVLSRYVQGIVVRTFKQADLETLAAAAQIPVINGLTDSSHPCQALADYFTIREEWGRLAGITLAYVGDGNNVAHSLLLAGAKLGVNVRVAAPPGYWPSEAVVARAREEAARTGASIEVMEDPGAAVRGADVVYTDVWTSMGQEAEAARRAAVFRPYQVNEALLRLAPGAIVLHCLPAHRGEEITDAVADGPAARLFEQAENRLHTQKALLATLLP